MEIKLVLNPRLVKSLIKHLGADKLTVLETDTDGYQYVSFEVNHSIDVLKLLHAGTDSGLGLGLYGEEGKLSSEDLGPEYDSAGFTEEDRIVDGQYMNLGEKGIR